MQAGLTEQLMANILPPNSYNKIVKCSCLDNSVASVSSTDGRTTLSFVKVVVK